MQPVPTNSEPHDELLTYGPVMQAMVRQAQQVAPTNTPVLIRGETGTGKERLAAAIHHWSRRAAAPFVKLNCAAVPAGLLESELFGHVKGAFTGATQNRVGRFQLADGGTLLLDEVGECPLPLQAKLLRVLQEGSFEPVGSDRTLHVNVRLLTATHADLEEAMTTGRFRIDLFYRLNVFPLHLPALRERLEDLPQLCTSLLSDLHGRTGKKNRWVTPAGLIHLSGYHWPGNVRELRNVLERAVILAEDEVLTPDLLSFQGSDRPSIPPPFSESGLLLPLAEVERRHIIRALHQAKGKIYGNEGAAALLDLKPSTLQSKMKKWGIVREHYLP